jgi:hypothetical protein
MRSFDEWNAGRFLRAADFMPGESFAVTVAAVSEEEVRRGDGTEQPALVLTLAREGKHWGDFLPNLSNRKILARLFGKDPMALVGQAFALVVVITSFEARNGFQVQPSVQQSAKAPPPPPAPKIVAPAANARPRAPKGKANSPAPPAEQPLLDDELPDFT